MTENINPEKTPPVTPDVPAGYDQPEAAAPSYQAPPSYDAPASFEPPAAPSYQQPAEPLAPAYPEASAQPGYQQGYPQQNVQQGYPQAYQQPAYGMAGVGEQKSKVVAGILGILLGSLGIHNFYLGKTKIALIQLLVSVISLGFLAPFMGIWGLVEGILILVGHESYRTDAKGVPLKD
ncbi:TM2 domain-containing protein [Arthrobacter alpinus]|uniref:TM2 domain-containing protein n=1 Tax=Arthrobacter alpinus TaxID=656366 RepID=A0A1H5L8Y1_9MICC|nr:TM2 domain-containing protein [Arthrobacter alpinus]SEE73539.1 TM2 domain-containing protein [Arthrobacter alpinus]